MRKTLLTVSETAERLRVSPKTVYRQIYAGQIPAVRIGTEPRSPLRVSEAELEAWLYARPDRQPR
jgi:excisionase family DNA binding protein